MSPLISHCRMLALMTVTIAALLTPPHAARAQTTMDVIEADVLRKEVESGKLPPLAKRLPESPLVTGKDDPGFVAGQHGGALRMLIGRARDVRMLYVYGYARLVGYDRNLKLAPDILERIENQDNRVFTLHLRKGHRWSDGHPFTTEDFRYYWEDVANNAQLTPGGPPADLLADGKPPEFKVIDPFTVRYSWASPNPNFLARLAGASPIEIYRPAHYLKQFHEKHAAAKDENAGKAGGDRQRGAPPAKGGGRHRSWAAQHNRMDGSYRFDNPDLPTLQPWVNTVRPPADRFVAVRNPYYHRVDPAGRQLPYLDRVELLVTEEKLIQVKSGAGESDLQARGLKFGDYTFLKKSEKQNDLRTLLWRSGRGSQMALFPNLNVEDPVWRSLLRDVRFRRALSLAIDRRLINQVLFFGLAVEANNTVMADSPLYEQDLRTLWARYDKRSALRLLDELNLKRGIDGIRRLPDGRALEIVVETAGESTEETDILELIGETWREVGVKLFVKPSQREVLRNRIYAGQTMMSVWSGLENALPSADTIPEELAPTSQQQLQWPKFGQYFETRGKTGVKPDIPEAIELLKLLEAWRAAGSGDERLAIWRRMLRMHAELQLVIGTVQAVPQPVVARKSLMNFPEKGLYNFDPGAYFGIYRPDTFWHKVSGR